MLREKWTFALFTIIDGEPTPADEVGALQGIRLLRENAWRNAEDLVAARNNPLALAVPAYGYLRDATAPRATSA